MNTYGLRLGFGVACATAAVLVLSAPLAGAGRSDDPPTDRRAAARTGTARPVTGVTRITSTSPGSHTASIVGYAWNADNSPIKFANLRLRDVVAGKIEALAKANDTGQFAFESIPAGSYVVELLNDAGKIETVGHVFTIAPGENVATFVRLGAKVPWMSSFFNNTAAALASTAASGGITAIAPPRLCSSPPCND
jgi:hypothetical protein